ncbi:MAG: glycosyltransferase family 2 protein [Campylobacterales bacterium]|nr:glycosyltransferase family 2 protein [Campylobacterales bacterium]
MITVLTPTYNRAYTLTRLFESLMHQNGSFEWLIIDDGSSDETQKLVEGFQSNALFEIRYMYQENSGKHIAINTGTAAARGAYCLIVDSDDALMPNALEVIEAQIAPHLNHIGWCFRRAYFNGTIIGNSTDMPQMIVMHPMQASHYFQGDLAYIFRTDALRAHPFPMIQGERFVPELLIWNCIADEGSICYFPHIAPYLCEYLPDGYSANFKKNLRVNPKGFGLYYADRLRREKRLIERLKALIRLLQCTLYGWLK